MYNSDLIEHVDNLYFETYKEFKIWLARCHGETTSEFVSQPMEFVDESEGLKFGRVWNLVDRYQSGKVMYRRK